jgi:hypothetical protein
MIEKKVRAAMQKINDSPDISEIAREPRYKIEVRFTRT